MPEGYAALIELLFSSAVVFGIGFWQLRSVRRELAKDREKAAAKHAEDAKAVK